MIYYHLGLEFIKPVPIFSPQLTSQFPVPITDFFITPDQVGLCGPAKDESTTSLQCEITQEFTAVMMEQRHNSHRGFEQQQERRVRSFGLGLAHQPDAVLNCLRFNKQRYDQLASPEHVQSSSSPILNATKCEAPKTAQEPPLPTDDSTLMETLE